ncbi:MAG: hypothetical protein Q8P57_03125 [Candidatus Pacearchaeota archaeon]|nr:hypothetical protein [Candidatus Pacearchaeota archaeon]
MDISSKKEKQEYQKVPLVLFWDFWMHEKSFMDFSAQRIARVSNSLVL